MLNSPKTKEKTKFTKTYKTVINHKNHIVYTTLIHYFVFLELFMS